MTITNADKFIEDNKIQKRSILRRFIRTNSNSQATAIYNPNSNIYKAIKRLNRKAGFVTVYQNRLTSKMQSGELMILAGKKGNDASSRVYHVSIAKFNKAGVKKKK